MSRLTLIQALLLNLARKIDSGRREYLAPDQAYQRLKQITGQDFGYDVAQWREWLRQNNAHKRKQRGPGNKKE